MDTKQIRPIDAASASPAVINAASLKRRAVHLWRRLRNRDLTFHGRRVQAFHGASTFVSPQQSIAERRDCRTVSTCPHSAEGRTGSDVLPGTAQTSAPHHSCSDQWEEMLTEIHDSITRLRDMLDRAQALSNELNAQQRRTGIRRFVHFSDGGGTARWQ